jgi:hypothetical protein
MKLLRPIAAAAICAAIVLAVSAFGASRASGQRFHLMLIERPISIFVRDNGPKGPSVGDQRTFHQELLFSNGKHAGTFAAQRQTPPSRATARARWSLGSAWSSTH